MDAGLSLDEVQRWIKRNTELQSEISINEQAKDLLGPSRAYTISLNPQIVYAKSRFLPALVSSQIHTQLEFQAVGSFYVLDKDSLTKIPSSREDVFADDTLSKRDKIRLMNLLRYVVDEHDQAEIEEGASMRAVLQDRFKLSQNLNAPVQALSLTSSTLENASFSAAATRLKRHFMSMGYFGPGLAAVMAKYGGNSELAQVACRAGAVGGFVYLLGQGVASIDENLSDSHAHVKLTDGLEVKAKHVVGTASDLPAMRSQEASSPQIIQISRRVSIVSNPMTHLFVAAAENGAVPAVAIILINTDENERAPVYLQIHSEDTGECPSGKCIIYASTVEQTSESQSRLENAILALLKTAGDESSPEVLWTLAYADSSPQKQSSQLDGDDRIIFLPERRHDLSLDDTVLDQVKAAWLKILGERSSEYDFLQFEERRDPNDEED